MGTWTNAMNDNPLFNLVTIIARLFSGDVLSVSEGCWNRVPIIGTIPDSKVHGAYMGPIWGRQDPGGRHVGPMNFVIWGYLDWTNLSSMNKSH